MASFFTRSKLAFNASASSTSVATNGRVRFSRKSPLKNASSLVKTVVDKIGDDTLGKFYRERILNEKPPYTKTLPKASGTTRIEQDLLWW